MRSEQTTWQTYILKVNVQQPENILLGMFNRLEAQQYVARENGHFWSVHLNVRIRVWLITELFAALWIILCLNRANNAQSQLQATSVISGLPDATTKHNAKVGRRSPSLSGYLSSSFSLASVDRTTGE